MFNPSSVQHGGAELPLCPKIGAAPQRRPAVISFNGLTRRNLSWTSHYGEIGMLWLFGRSPLITFVPSAVRRRYQSAGRPS